MELCGVADSGESRTSRASESSTEQTDRQTGEVMLRIWSGPADSRMHLKKWTSQLLFERGNEGNPTLPYPTLT